MNKYSMKCSCGDVITVEAESKEAAVEMMKAQWTEEAVKQHFSEKHPGQEVPPMEQIQMMIEQGVQEGDMSSDQAAA